MQSVEAPAGAQDTALPGYAVAAIREEGRWRCARMAAEALVDLDAAITELRALRSTGAVLGLLDVDDEFFVLLRPTPGGVSLMVSDAVAALDYDVAADVLDLLRVELPETTTSPTPRRGPRAISRSWPTSACPPTSWRSWRPSRSSTRTSSSRRSAAAAGSREALAEVVDGQ